MGKGMVGQELTDGLINIRRCMTVRDVLNRGQRPLYPLRSMS